MTHFSPRLQPERVVRTTCPYCGVGCQMNLHLKDGLIYRVTAPFDAAPNHGNLCVKGRFGVDFTTHPGRLTTPLIRTGARGAGQFRPASWEEALALVAEQLAAIARAHGGDSVATYACAKATNEDNYVFQKWIRAVLKTNNVDHCARLCHAGSVTGLQLAIGSSAMSNSIAEMEHLDTFIVTGSNTTETHPVISLFLKKAVRQNGAKLIVIDPRRIELVDFATLWLRQKPGTDVAVFQAMAHVIVTEKLYRPEFIAERTEGFEAYVESLEPFTPEWAESISGVPADDIRAAARLYAQAERAAFYWGMGISQSTHGTDNALALTNLALMTGHIGKPGTGLNPLRGQNNVQGCSDSGGLPNVYTAYQRVDDPAVRARFELAWRTSLPPEPGLTVTEMVDGALRGTVKAMIVMGENPLMSEPNLNHARHALEQLDLIVCIDIFMNETGEMADVILPSVSFAEKDGTFTNSDRRVQRVRAALPPVGQARADWQIVCDLARRTAALLGVETHGGFDYPNPEAIWEEMRAVTPDFYGITYERLEREGGVHWPCPSLDHPGTPYLFEHDFPRGRGKFWALEYGTESELPDDDYPYHLTTGRVLFHWHGGTMTRRSKLDDIFPEPILEMHPDDAHALGLISGDWVEVESRRGAVVCRVMATGRSPVGTVFLPFHFVEAAANLLTYEKTDPRAKIPDFKMAAVRLRKVDAPPGREGADIPLTERGAIKDPTLHVH
ncbi:MAG: formate dehydrogenase subunit alpha [Aggregatilineales bacterium]